MMFARLVIFAAFLFLSGISLGQEQFEVEINKLLNDPGMKGAGLGICIENLENDSVVFEINSNLSMIPASVLKIVTTSAALEILGADYTFKTQLLYTGKIDDKTGFLNGNLIIKGGGDPALGSEYFKDHYLKPHFLNTWLNEIILSGIRGINGNIIINESAYEEQSVPDTWIWEDMGNYYGAGANALTVYDNMFRIYFRSLPEAGKPAEIIYIDPWANWLTFENFVVSSDQNSDNAYIFGDPWGGKRKIRGTIPIARDTFQIKASLPEPGLSLGYQLKEKLESKNIPLKGVVKKGVPVNVPE
ncbi:MAG: D-alanyl-D-alanine carboxypeptidase, partial [Prolixibacteraceae bacterium]|nr:D-alanyl-D-alanine carboxypeptidase [Prolixibacteraceae bacterium]